MRLAEMTFPHCLRRHAAQRGDVVALSFEGRRTSFAALDEQSTILARAMLSAAGEKPLRVLYLAKNSDRYFEILLGTAKAHGVFIPISWRLAAAEVDYILSDAEIGVIFADRDTFDLCTEVTREKPEILVIPLEPVGPGVLSYTEFRLSGELFERALPDITSDDIFLQLYTSGTTGRPKGAMISHRNFFALREQTFGTDCDWDQWQQGDISLVQTPLSHIGAAGWGLLGIYNGVTSVIARDFDPAGLLDFIENHGVNRFFTVPSALRIILSHPRVRELDYTRLSCILYGASPMPPPLLREAIEVFRCKFIQTYGMTETTGAVTYLPAKDHRVEGDARMNSVGIPVPGVEIMIVDGAGNLLPPGTAGEVVIRSPSNIVGYWKQPALSNDAFSADGWLRSGDAGLLDADGYLFIQDRIKDIIVSGGENISPTEVENALHGHPDVADVAVIGVPDETWGEAVKAIIVPRGDAAPDSASLLAYAEKSIARFKIPKSFDFVKSIPKNAAGKVLRRELREPYWSNNKRRVN